MTYEQQDYEIAELMFRDDFRVRDLAKLITRNRVLATALENLLNWGRDHTSPRDANSPHELLVAAAEALQIFKNV